MRPYRHGILPLLAALLLLLAGCPAVTPTPEPTPPDERPDPVPHPGPPPGHSDPPSRWEPWPEPDVSHLIDIPEPPEPPEPREPEEPERPAPVPKPLGPPGEFGQLEPWRGAVEPVIDWETCCQEPGEQGEEPTQPTPPGPPPPTGDDPEPEPEVVDETQVLGLQAVVHADAIAFVWAAPVKHSPGTTSAVRNYKWTVDPPSSLTKGGTKEDSGEEFHIDHPQGRKSQSVRFEDVPPLTLFTFTVYATFRDQKSGTPATVSETTGPAPPEPPPPPPTCAAVNAALKATGDRVEYNGQCHDEDWTYYTLDATTQGYESVTVHYNENGHFVCGHNNPNILSNGQWCSSNAEWAKVGGT